MLFHGGHKQKRRVSNDHSNLDMRRGTFWPRQFVNCSCFAWSFQLCQFISWSTLCWCFRLGGDVGPICWYVTAFDICFKIERWFFRQFVCTQSASILLWDMKATNAGAPHLGSRRDHRGARNWRVTSQDPYIYISTRFTVGNLLRWPQLELLKVQGPSSWNLDEFGIIWPLGGMQGFLKSIAELLLEFYWIHWS